MRLLPGTPLGPHPKKVSVRPAMGSEGDGFVVWVYGRRVQIQLAYPVHYNRPTAVLETIELWRATTEEIS